MYFNKLYCFSVYMKNMFIRVGCHEDDMLMKNKTPDSVIQIQSTNSIQRPKPIICCSKSPHTFKPCFKKKNLLKQKQLLYQDSVYKLTV